MNTLCETTDVLAKLRSYLTPFFEGFTRPTAQKLIWIVIAMIAIGGARSVRNLPTDFLAGLDIVSLNALYHALSYAKRPLKLVFARTTALMMLKAVPAAQKNQPLFLSVDDTLIPKFGKKFVRVGILFDHAAHDGRPYKNGHCLVCIVLSIPVGVDRETGRARYLSVPLLVQVWQKDGPSKLQIAHDLLYELRDSLMELGSFVLLVDSWYPSATCSHVKFTKHGRLGRHKEPMTNWQELQ